jgi:hypothetical protein
MVRVIGDCIETAAASIEVTDLARQRLKSVCPIKSGKNPSNGF